MKCKSRNALESVSDACGPKLQRHPENRSESSQTGRLLAIPREIRNTIYEFYTGNDIAVEITTSTSPKEPIDSSDNWAITTFEGQPGQPLSKKRGYSLSKVCQQIRNELLPMLASQGHIYLHQRSELRTPLPSAYISSIQEITLSKGITTLKGQSWTRTMPKLRSIRLEFPKRRLHNLINRVGHAPWTRAALDESNFHVIASFSVT